MGRQMPVHLELPWLELASVLAALAVAALLATFTRLLADSAARGKSPSARADAETVGFALGDTTAELLNATDDEKRQLAIEHALRFFDNPSAGAVPGATWRSVSSSAAGGGLQVFHHCGEHMHSIKICMKFDYGADVLIATAREIDLVPSWNHYVPFACICEEYSDTSLRAAGKFWSPYPLPNVRVVINATLDDLMNDEDTRGFLVTFSSPAPPAPPVPPELQGLLEVPTHGLMRYRPCAPDGASTEMELICHLPASIVASWMLEIVLYVATPWIHRAAVAMLSSATRPGELLSERILRGPKAELYARIRERSRLGCG
ncbi:hypothetical protein T492DRAFT_985790 [Pavlovales sp. CCMP2436]|nr:hypothetical protein T492DRAFT_985790 [Pavlovales sp. CCMP2436]|mmetsp:Transcript_14796/g.37354  ORF Transcript_14796/g.37354 Transcript_14796/m.37354 type:complete len:318 (-) Transcript_14796:116-1069(-)